MLQDTVKFNHLITEVDLNKFSKSATVVVSHCLRIAKRLQEGVGYYTITEVLKDILLNNITIKYVTFDNSLLNDASSCTIRLSQVPVISRNTNVIYRTY